MRLLLTATFLLAGLLPAQAAAPGSLPLAAEQKEFDMHLYAPFLEPGLDGQAPAGEVMPHGALEWTSPTEGRLLASLWFKKALVEFQTTPDRKTVTAVTVNLGNNDKPGQSGFDVWRHRHSYLKIPGQGYAWNSISDTRPAMASTLGADYDAVLAGVWTLWARRTVNQLLAGSTSPEAALEENGSAQLNKKMTMRYNGGGLVGSAAGNFTIRLWGAAVAVEFEIKGRQPTHQNPYIIDLARPIKVSYGKQEWRLRHGYARGGAWDEDFINAPAAAMTSRLDDLLGASAKYWADVAVHVVLEGLDRQLKDAIGQLPPAALAVEPSVKTLETIQSEQTWPQ